MGFALEHGNQRVGEVGGGGFLPAKKIHYVVLQRGKAFHAKHVVRGGDPGRQRRDIVLPQVAFTRN